VPGGTSTLSHACTILQFFQHSWDGNVRYTKAQFYFTFHFRAWKKRQGCMNVRAIRTSTINTITRLYNFIKKNPPTLFRAFLGWECARYKSSYFVYFFLFFYFRAWKKSHGCTSVRAIRTSTNIITRLYNFIIIKPSDFV
jgi:hypothetical protein